MFSLSKFNTNFWICLFEGRKYRGKKEHDSKPTSPVQVNESLAPCIVVKALPTVLFQLNLLDPHILCYHLTLFCPYTEGVWQIPIHSNRKSLLSNLVASLHAEIAFRLKEYSLYMNKNFKLCPTMVWSLTLLTLLTAPHLARIHTLYSGQNPIDLWGEEGVGKKTGTAWFLLTSLFDPSGSKRQWVYDEG